MEFEKKYTEKIKEANLFIETKQRLTEAELKIWIYAIKNAKEDKKHKRAYAEIDLNLFVSEYLKEKVRVGLPTYYKNVVENLMKKTIFWIKKEELMEFLSISGGDIPEKLKKTKKGEIAIAPIEFVELEGSRAVIFFSQLISPIILRLSKKFTLYTSDVFALKGKYPILLYRLLKKELQGKKYGRFVVSLEKLKQIFGLEKKYSSSGLYSKIVKPAVEKINQSTFLEINGFPVRKGKGGRIVEILFEVRDFYDEDTEKLNLLVKSIARSLEMDEESFLRFLAELERIKPNIALLFLTMYPPDLRSQALKKLLEIDGEKSYSKPNMYILKKLMEEKEFKTRKWLATELAEAKLNKKIYTTLKTEKVNRTGGEEGMKSILLDMIFN